VVPFSSSIIGWTIEGAVDGCGSGFLLTADFLSGCDSTRALPATMVVRRASR